MHLEIFRLYESKKHLTVALSTREAECMALSHTRFLNTLSLEAVTEPTILLCDNHSAQKLAYYSFTKHTDICHSFVREIYDTGEIDVKYLETENIGTDILVKALNANKHKE